MQDLTPVALSKDRKRLVLISASGVEYSVEIDQKFRSVLRGDQARLGQLEMTMESTLRPRDIQARIRAGESAEDVAAAAQTTVDAIMPFASPVLAERAHVAQTAVKCSIRRASADSAPVGRTLDEASRTRFSATGVRADMADLTLAVALEYVRFRHGALYDAEVDAALAPWLESWSARPTLVLTTPAALAARPAYANLFDLIAS